MELNQLIALITVLAQVVFLEGVLSLDNAAVLGAIVLRLPADQPVPWPRALSRLGQRLHVVLGMQRTAGLRVGLLGAYLGRGLMLVLASFVIRNPWLQLVGALYLLKMSVGELASHGDADDDQGDANARMLRERSFWSTVLTVELMDLAFSLDNVVVVVTLSNELWLVMVGVALGILTMRFAAGVFSGLIEKIPALGPAAYVLVFNIGVEFILARFGVDLGQGARFGVNIGVLAAAVIYSRVPFLQRLMRWPFRVFGWLFTALDQLFTLVLAPFGYLWKKVTNFFRSTNRRRTELPQSGND
jgi:tellurite resistance protein TerC